jgi:hypothetical protein
LKLNHLLDEDFLLALEKWAPSCLPSDERPLSRGRRNATVSGYTTVSGHTTVSAGRGKGRKQTLSPSQDPEAVFAALLEAEGVCLYLDTTATLTYTGAGPECSHVGAGTSKFAYTRRLAAALGVVTLRQDKPLYLRTLSPTGTGHAPLLCDTAQIPRLLTLLKRLEAGSNSDFLWSFYHQLARRTPRASVIVILSDFLGPLWEEALLLLYQHAAPYSEIVLLQVLHPEERAILQNTFSADSVSHSVNSDTKTGLFHWVDLATQATRPIELEHNAPPSLPHLPPREVRTIQAFLHRLQAQSEVAASPQIALCSLTTDMSFEKYLLRALQSTR